MFEPSLADVLPSIAPDERNPLKLHRDLYALDCHLDDPALELMSNQSFGTTGRFTYEFGEIHASSVLQHNPLATISDVLALADTRQLAVLDQTIPFFLVAALLASRHYGVKGLPQKWSFVVSSLHSDPRPKVALVTVRWADINPLPALGVAACRMGGFRPTDHKLVRDRPLNHPSVADSIFIFNQNVKRTPIG